MNDSEKIQEWQKTHDAAIYNDLHNKYNGIMYKFVNQYANTGVNRETLKATAQTQFIKALNSYNPNLNTQPVTHIWNNMKRIQRTATESLMSGHIPEYRNLKKSTFATSLANLKDRLGYEPNVQQLSEELGWDKKEVSKLLNEMNSETTASSAEFDFYGNSKVSESEDKSIIDYLYHESDDIDKIILEHTVGLGGKPQLNNKEIAKKLGKNEMWISRRKNKLSDKLLGYRGITS